MLLENIALPFVSVGFSAEHVRMTVDERGRARAGYPLVNG